MRSVLVGLSILVFTTLASAQSPDDYLGFIRVQAAKLRADDRPPTSLDEWKTRNAKIREQLLQAWGGFPKEKVPLNPKNLGQLQRDGFRVEKIVFQTLPDVWMTANAYVPDRPGKLPAILMVHGHWRGAKQDPVVQSRCIGAAKLGFFVLVVDAFGAGERGVGKALGEYHGDMTAATLLPVGIPLSGIQVYENIRAVDYLRSRPEVDSEKIGITGASGGGNQTMYAGSWDERFKSVVPVCSVGNYQAYLGTGCCMCEVVPGALRFTEEGGILGLVAPRGLMVVNATKDGIQFSVGEAKKSIAYAEPIFKLAGKPDGIRHTIFESPHDYSKAMREAMYGWMTLHLKGEGDGSPIPEAPLKTEEPESIRCYPGDSRPADWMTIPKFAAREGKKLVASRPVSPDQQRAALERVLGGFPAPSKASSKLEVAAENSVSRMTFESEPGITLRFEGTRWRGVPGVVILLNLEGADKARKSDLAKSLQEAGWGLVTCELRATGTLASGQVRVGRAPDHHAAEWGLWIGRPLLGQWTYDVRRLLDHMPKVYEEMPKRIVVIGEGPAGLVALCAAATDSRITGVAAVGSLASYVSDTPYQNQRLGIIVPGILRDVGDVGHLAALVAPRRIVLAGGVSGDGTTSAIEQLRATYRPALEAAERSGSAAELKILDAVDTGKIIEALR
jgi:cephalosporin-C deacetylase-like acetyl esterase